MATKIPTTRKNSAANNNAAKNGAARGDSTHPSKNGDRADSVADDDAVTGGAGDHAVELNGAATHGAGASGAPRRRATAQSMAASQRDISVSEFFAKNRHLLGFDNPRKALLTTVKEAVDNSLDACEEAGILPEIWVHIEQTGPARFKVAVQDNGPGIVSKQIPLIFGKLLYGSKFHRLRMSRGQQGIGISAAGMYGVLTTGKPVKIISRVSERKLGVQLCQRPLEGDRIWGLSSDAAVGPQPEHARSARVELRRLSSRFRIYGAPAIGMENEYSLPNERLFSGFRAR